MQTSTFALLVAFAGCGQSAAPSETAQPQEQAPPTLPAEASPLASDDEPTSDEVAAPAPATVEAVETVATLSRPTRSWWTSHTCSAGEDIALPDGVEREPLLAVDERGGLVLWKSGTRELSVLPIDAAGVARGEAVVHDLGVDLRKRGRFAGQRRARTQGDHILFATTARCERRHCVHGFAFDRDGARVGTQATEAMTISARAMESLPPENDAADRLWVSFRIEGGRDASMDLYSLHVEDGEPVLTTGGLGIVATPEVRAEFSGTTYYTTGYLQYAEGAHHNAITGWSADGNNRTVIGRSLFLGGEAGQLMGLRGRLRGFATVGDRAHALLEHPRRTFHHVILVAGNPAIVEAQTEIDIENALPGPFAERVRLDQDRQGFSIKDTLGRSLGETMAVANIQSLAFTGNGWLGLGRGVLTPIPCVAQ